MEELIKTMANKVDAKEIVGYLVSYCTQENTGDYEITTSARVTEDFPSPYRLYVPLLGKLFLTIAQGHPEPETLIQRIIVEAHKEFKETLKRDSKKKDEFTAAGKF